MRAPPPLLGMRVVAHIIGEHARALLDEGAAVVVVARTSQALFLSREDEVLWISPNPVLHRRALLVPRLPLWPEDMVLAVSGGFLVGGGRDALGFQEAARWSPPVLPPPPGDLAARATTLARHFVAPCRQVEEWLGTAKVRRVQEAIRAEDGLGLVEAAQDLVGYGPGLTPLGDDFLGGVLFALRVAQQHRILKEWPELGSAAQGRTTGLSLSLLLDLGQGHGPEPLHALAFALFAGAEDGARTAAHRLLKVGHTTGPGLLCGALLAWSALV